MSRASARTSRDSASMEGMSSSYAVLDGLYAVHDELGCGGFGKVKLATHLLTSQRVAIKIIDKKAIGDDLPRIKTELEALKTLSHQNICRLYQSIETDDKFFIIMEYCSGGEMFDYIVKKERLEESEARHFFRQLVQAIAYVHDMGFAHRDLKPENLLLTEELQLKLIDFGLCARPDMGLNRPLDTCCGSPAYAAPELIQGAAYLGNEADVWSMGVLLYTLLCGALPFEDDNMQTLYRKISRGIYHQPDYLSASSKDLLRCLLQVDPKLRIGVRELIVHPWLNKKYSQPLRWKSVYDRKLVDGDVCRELALHFCKPIDDMHQLIKEWRFDYLTATYFLLLLQKRKGLQFALPPPRVDGWKDPTGALLSSPTIHASLEVDLNKSGLHDEALTAQQPAPEKHALDSMRKARLKPFSPISHCDKNASYACAMLDMPSVCTGRSPQQRAACHVREHPDCLLPLFGTPLRQRHQPQRTNAFDSHFYYRPADDKENYRSATVRLRGPVKLCEEGRPRSGMYGTPVKMNLHGLCSPQVRSRSSERHSPPCTPRVPRSATKTPRLRQRVFASLERHADKMIHLLTPRKIKNHSPDVLKQTKTMVNVSITSSQDPELVMVELMRVFAEQDICVEQHGWKISGRKRDEFNRLMTVELEVVLIELGNRQRLVGVKRRRLSGDAFLYKKVCEMVLRMAGL